MLIYVHTYLQVLSLPSLEADRLVGLEDLPVTALAASPDGSRIVSGGDFRDLKVTGSKAGGEQAVSGRARPASSHRFCLGGVADLSGILILKLNPQSPLRDTRDFNAHLSTPGLHL